MTTTPITYWCAECDSPIEGADIEDRHSREDGEDVHERCCQSCHPKAKCLSCQYEAERISTGRWRSPRAQQHWERWGCTCDPEDEANALAYMKAVTQ